MEKVTKSQKRDPLCPTRRDPGIVQPVAVRAHSDSPPLPAPEGERSWQERRNFPRFVRVRTDAIFKAGWLIGAKYGFNDAWGDVWKGAVMPLVLPYL